MDLNNLSQFNNLSEEEKKAVLSILDEYSSTGESKLFNDIKYADYNEIPVDILTFILDDNYLGKAWHTAEGKSKLFPFWEDKFKKLFPDNTETSVNNVILSGARGLGKSEIGVTCGAYLMYRVMCLKNPLLYFGMKPTEKICFAFMNITKTLAEGIAISKFQKTIQMSPWFMARGKMTQYNNAPYWTPPEPLNIIIGSQPSHVIGQPILFCLDGDTIIKTNFGDQKLSSLVDKDIQVISIDDEGKEILSNTCTVMPTLKTKIEYQIELEDGTVLKCTPNHKFMLKDGTYKEAQYLSEEDELFDENITYKDFIQNIINERGQWNIPKGEYFEVHHIIPKCLGGDGDVRIGGKLQQHPNLIYLYAHEHFIAHKLLAKENPNNASLVYAWSMMAFPKGKTDRSFEITPEEYTELRIMQSKIKTGTHLSCEVKEKISKSLYGKKLSESTKKKISDANKGKVMPESARKKISDSAKNRDRINYRTIKGKICITNGTEVKYVNSDTPIPNGWYRGNCKLAKKRDMTKYYANEAAQIRNKLSKSGSSNSMWGNGYRVSGGNNGHAIYIYSYKGSTFNCRKDLMEVLKEEFPSITENVVRLIVNGTYTKRISNKYMSLINNLTWRLKNEN